MRRLAIHLAVLLGTSLTQATMASAVDCAPPAPGEPTFVDESCTDTRWNDPFVDIDEMRTTPVPHRYVHGGFNGTSARFAFYFPPAEQYQGRFIQGPVHPLTLNENLGNTQIAFVIASGGYAVMTNQGGAAEAPITSDGVIIQGKNPEIFYRVNAAAAKYSRQVAADYYGPHRPYGYIFGGSGGAYQSVSCMENTSVWDGAVPFVQGSESAIPTAYTVRIHVQRILGPTGKFACIDQAYDAGGSGDPATECALTEEEAGALEEATRGGFPTRGWFGGALTGAGALPLVAGYVPFLDYAYINDFWTLPGYLGHDDPYGSMATARIQHHTTVIAKLSGNRIQLDTFPTGNLTAIDLQVESGAGASTIGQQGFPAGWAQSPATNAGAKTVTLGGNYVPIYNAIAVGDQVRLDNSLYLALQTYHRHQIGGPVQAYYPWDQFRDPQTPSGSPIYPQRSILTGIVGQHNGSGGNITGKFNGKLIIQESLMDVDAHPWGADWYKRRAQAFLGNKLDDRFRVYMQDYAQHGAGTEGGTSTRTVSYNGALQHDLRTLAAWVEQGVKPPSSTSYAIENFGQVTVPPLAGQRKGIQPVVTLLANDAARADVAVGDPVTLSGKIQVPPGAGKVVKVEWNVTGATGAYVPVPFGDLRPSVSVETTTSFSTPGTYFVVLRGTSQREGNADTPFARVENIGRARVVVH